MLMMLGFLCFVLLVGGVGLLDLFEMKFDLSICLGLCWKMICCLCLVQVIADLCIILLN